MDEAQTCVDVSQTHTKTQSLACVEAYVGCQTQGVMCVMCLCALCVCVCDCVCVYMCVYVCNVCVCMCVRVCAQNSISSLSLHSLT